MILTNNTLIFCRKGIDLFKQHFVNGKYKGQNDLLIPYSFLLLASTYSCPKGKFYELEYTTTGNQFGFVHRALIQAVYPDMDIMLMLGAAKRYGLLPEGFTTLQAFLRDDIEKVHIVGCVRDDRGEPTIIGPERPASTATSPTIASRVLDGVSTIIEYYQQEQAIELSVQADDFTCFDQIFICGGENVNKPIFAERRKASLQEMCDLFDQAIEIAQDFNLNYVLAFETGDKDKDGNDISRVMACENGPFRLGLAKYLATTIN